MKIDNSGEMPGELKAKRDELAKKYIFSIKADCKSLITYSVIDFNAGFDKCYELMMAHPEFQPLAKRLDWQIKKCMELEEREAKLKAQLAKAIEFIKSLQNHKQEGWFEDTLATMALKEIEEAGK